MTCNFCTDGTGCRRDLLRHMDVREAVIAHLGGLELRWPRQIESPKLPDLPTYLPVLVQAYADPVNLPWVAIHGSRLLGRRGQRLTPKHRGRALRDVYRLSSSTRVALEFFVEDRVLEGVWARRRELLEELGQLDVDLVLAPNFSVWRDASRFEQLVQQRRAWIVYHEMIEAGLPAIPDISWSIWEPDGRLWAQWVNSQPGVRAVSIYCGEQRIHAERRAHRESVEDVALFHRAVRPNVAFVIGGIHSPARLRDYRLATPGRQLVICNAQAYSLAQRRRLLGEAPALAARSARQCFLLNCDWCTQAYRAILDGFPDAIQK